MWTLYKRVRFEASHVLPNHEGVCRRMHGHSYTVEVEIRGNALQTDGPEAGMVTDMGHVGTQLKGLVGGSLDHHHLNETTGLVHPTAEALARWVFERMEPQLPGLVAVTIEETSTSKARYEP